MTDVSPSLADRIDSGYGTLLTAGAVAAATILGGMLVMITVDVLMRNLFVSGVKGVIEFTEMGLYVSTVLAAPWLLRRGEHIKVDLLRQFGSERVFRLADAASDIIGCAVVATVGWYAVQSTMESYRSASVMRRSIDIPEWLMLLPLAVCMGLLALEFLLRLRRALVRPPGAAAAERQDF